eukprot:scaffold187054_cov27-Tisochrysis_lutea.AAC.2
MTNKGGNQAFWQYCHAEFTSASCTSGGELRTCSSCGKSDDSCSSVPNCNAQPPCAHIAPKVDAAAAAAAGR